MVRYRSLAFLGFTDYRVGDDGTVWSRKVYGSRFGRVGPWWKMKPKKARKAKNFYGDLFREVSKPQRFNVAWLVLEAFVAPRPKGKIACHKDDEPGHDWLDNLYWGTKKSNFADAVANERASHGDRHYNATLTNEQVREIRKLAEDGMSHRKIGERFGKGQHYIARIACREIWKHVT